MAQNRVFLAAVEHWATVPHSLFAPNTVISLVSGYHPWVRHLAIQQDIWLGQKIQKNIRFGTKNYTNCFVGIKGNLVFSSIVTTNIQKTLESTRLMLGNMLEKGTKSHSHIKNTSMNVAILCSICILYSSVPGSSILPWYKATMQFFSICVITFKSLPQKRFVLL